MSIKHVLNYLLNIFYCGTIYPIFTVPVGITPTLITISTRLKISEQRPWQVEDLSHSNTIIAHFPLSRLPSWDGKLYSVVSKYVHIYDVVSVLSICDPSKGLSIIYEGSLDFFLKTDWLGFFLQSI